MLFTEVQLNIYSRHKTLMKVIHEVALMEMNIVFYQLIWCILLVQDKYIVGARHFI